MELGYKFTSKELDAETNLYYFGARYYDAVLSKWISADKALERYLPSPNDFDTEHDYFWYLAQDASNKLPGIGGVFNSGNLNLYGYGLNNPVKLTDPDGNFVVNPALLEAAKQGAKNVVAVGLGIGATITTAVISVVSFVLIPTTMGDGELQNRKKPPVHHIATNKNEISTARGGPWTQKFQDLFEKAGMSLDDPANKVEVIGHKGPHPRDYHQAVYDRLNKAVKGKDPHSEAYKKAFSSELGKLKQECATPGTRLNNMITKPDYKK